jgi:hypothetical protein
MSPREADKQYSSDTESTDSTVESTVTKSRKTVSFGVIQIREYNRVLGDNPDVRVGPPVSIGWEYVQNEALALNDYEINKPERKHSLRMSSITRKNILKNVFGVPEADIVAAEKEVQKIRKQRLQTSHQGKTGRVVESAMQSAKRRLSRTFSTENLLKGLANSGGMTPMMSV